MSSSSHTITIPTKQHDGGNDKALKAFSPKSKVDAFAKYSSNLIRMKTLLLLGDNEDHGDDDDSLDYLGPLNDVLRYIRVSDHVVRSNPGPGDASKSKRRKGNNSHPITITEQGSGSGSGVLERKTRISFELHPDLLLHDLFDLHLHASDLIPDDEDDDEDESKE